MYIIKTGATVFGVHRATDDGQATTTHIIGFRRRMYADVLAESLESHRARTGTFPPRDDVAGGLDCLADIGQIDHTLKDSTSDAVAAACADAVAACVPACVQVQVQVCVEEVNVAGMLERLEGTGMALTVVYEDSVGELAWVDVRPRNDMSTVINTLDGAFDSSPTQTANDAVPAAGLGGHANMLPVPPLLPKPVRKKPVRKQQVSHNDFSTYSAMTETRMAMCDDVCDDDNKADVAGSIAVPPAMVPGMLWATAWLAAQRSRRSSGFWAHVVGSVMKWIATKI